MTSSNVSPGEIVSPAPKSEPDSSIARDKTEHELLGLIKNAAREGMEEAHDRVLAIGGIGAGKTTQIRSLPGRKFAYLFDSSALPSLQGDANIDYLEFLPDVHEVDLSIKTLKKDVSDKSIRSDIEPTLYIKWYEDFMSRCESGGFKKYDWLIFDSFTTFSDIVMDRVQHLNKRLGKQPEQADYAAEMNTMKHVFRTATGAGCNLYTTAHIQHEKDTEKIGGESQTVGKAYGKLLMTGRNRIRIPLQFSTILAFECDSDAKQIKYIVQTSPSDKHPVVRHTIPGLKFQEDVTLDFSKPLEQQGLGRLLSRNRNKQLMKTAITR